MRCYENTYAELKQAAPGVIAAKASRRDGLLGVSLKSLGDVQSTVEACRAADLALRDPFLNP